MNKNSVMATTYIIILNCHRATFCIELRRIQGFSLLQQVNSFIPSQQYIGNRRKNENFHMVSVYTII